MQATLAPTLPYPTTSRFGFFRIIIRERYFKINHAGRKFLRPARFSVFVKDVSAKIAIFKFGYSLTFWRNYEEKDFVRVRTRSNALRPQISTCERETEIHVPMIPTNCGRISREISRMIGSP